MKAEKLVLIALESSTEKKNNEAVYTVEHSMDDAMDCTGPEAIEEDLEEEKCENPDGVKIPPRLSVKSAVIRG